MKLNTDIPLNKRQNMYDSVLNTLNISTEKKRQYELILP